MIADEWFKPLESNSGDKPKWLIENSNLCCNLTVFSNKKLNNVSVLKELKAIIAKENKKILCKDYSYLGFNTYKLYIPGISEICSLTSNDWLYLKEYQFLKHTLLRLNTATDENVKKLLSIISELSSSIKYSPDRILTRISELCYSDKMDFESPTSLLLLTACSIKVKDYEKALSFLTDYLAFYPISELENGDYFDALKSALNLINNNYIEVYNYLIGKYDDTLVNEVIDDLNGSADILNSFIIPSCTENSSCQICKMSNICRIENWKKLSSY